MRFGAGPDRREEYSFGAGHRSVDRGGGTAARTQRVRLGITVTPLCVRLLVEGCARGRGGGRRSGGRFTLGVGLGGGPQC